MNDIEKYYNKFNEDKRLTTRHGQVEFTVAWKYIVDCIGGRKNLSIIDIGAGTGKYSVRLAEEGHKVVAVELVKKNLRQIEQKSKLVDARLGNALNLKKFKDDTFDIALLFGPMYHLMTYEEKLQALNEAKRVTKKNGYILVMYIMNEYAVITYAFKEGNLQECLKAGKLDENFKCCTKESDLYSYVRLEDIDKLSIASRLTREKIIAVDGATDYIRPYINKLTEEDFQVYIQYQLSIAERKELLGASSHVLDILKK